MGLINLYSVDSSIFDNEYQNVCDFKNIQNQMNYFSQRIIHQFDGNIIIQPSRVALSIKQSYQWVLNRNVNYVSLITDGKQYYYFVKDIIYKGKDVTMLELEIDVWQTYLFDYEILDSFINRCHVNRWVGDTPAPYCEIEEDLPYGELILKSDEEIYKLRKAVVVTSTVPLGKIQTTTGGGSGNEGSSGSIQEGIISASGLLFIKQEEGFAQYGAYFNGENFKTGGYGVTEKFQTEYYRQLEPFPVSEKKASLVTYNLLNTEFGKGVLNLMKGNGVNINLITQYQFDIWVSIAFNYGLGGLMKLTPWQTFLANPKETERIAREISFLKSNPDRRKREAEVYRTGVYPRGSITKYDINAIAVGVVNENGGLGWLPTDKPSGKYVDNKAGSNWLIPVSGTISGGYPTYPSGKPHNAIDIACEIGTPIYASKDGTVIKREELTTSYGKHLVITHGESDVVYAHCSQLLVNLGDNVKQGQMIARSGNTGNSSGAHLHWEIRNPNGEIIQHNVKTVNPMPEYKVGDKV